MRLYHFTSTWHIPAIIETGISQGEVPLRKADHGIKGVWLTTNNDNSKQDWIAGCSLDKAEIRISLTIDDAAPLLFKWDIFSKLVNIKKASLRSFNSYGDGAKHWWVYLGELPTKTFDLVEIYNNGKWSILPTHDLKNEYDYEYAESHTWHYNLMPVPAIIQNIISYRSGLSA